MDLLSRSIRSKNKDSENVDPNVNSNSPVVVKSAKSQKSASKNPNNPVIYSPKHKIRQRKFVVAKKHAKIDDEGSLVSCKCKDKCGGGNPKKCLCVAYENLRASQEEFFKNRGDQDQSKKTNDDDRAESELIEMSLMIQDLRIGGDDEYEGKKTEACESEKADANETESPNQVGSSMVKRRRNKFLEDARNSVPETGSGRVMHLVKAFETLRAIPMSKGLLDPEEDEKQPEETKKETKWELPGLKPPKQIDTDDPSSSFCPSQLILTSENLGLDPRIPVSSSWDSSRGSISSRTSGGRRSRRNSVESSSSTLGRRRWKKQQLKVTSQKPFKLRTEQRGKMKEEDFMRKVHEMMTEEEKQRIPIAQGLPWTTDEPECLVKPPVKDNTRPIDLKLHSDLRAMDRAVFDHQVAEKMSIIEQYKMERERQQKLEEEEEIRRLRKELIPKAQPMPYFDRPFIPRRSMKHPTIPREPKFHIPQHKKIKCCLSWNDMSSYTYIN